MSFPREQLTRYLRLSLGIRVGLSGHGCAQLFAALEPGARHVKGEWFGRLRSLSVVDADGRHYDAAALEIIEGPRMPYRPDTTATDEVETARVALLSRSANLPLMVVNPDQLETPAGTLVRVEGRMQLGALKAPDPEAKGFIEPASTAPGWQVDDELAILLRGVPNAAAD